MKFRPFKNLLVALVLLMLTVLPARAADEDQLGNPPLVWGKVIKIITQVKSDSKAAQDGLLTQTMLIKLTSGEFKGRVVKVTNTVGLNPAYDIKVREGDGVVVALNLQDGKITSAGIADHLREPQIYFLIAIFVILLLLVGWSKGLKALVTLLFTLGLIMGLVLPGFLRGYNPIALTLALAMVVTVVNTLIVGGWSRKSAASMIGTFGGLAIAGLIAFSIGKAANLTGFGTEEASMLLYLPKNVHLNIQGLLFAGIIIGALGAVMDVSMSVASAIEEVHRVSPGLTMRELFRCGMNVGRDIMGIMANTLILAYTGSSITLLLIFMAYQDSITLIMNLDLIASEIVRALSGSIGMIMVVPLTAAVAGLLFGNRSQESQPPADDNPAEEKEYSYWDDWGKK